MLLIILYANRCIIYTVISELTEVRDLLSVFLRAMNKEVHMFSVGKVDGV